jgi:hypothetical protein
MKTKNPETSRFKDLNEWRPFAKTLIDLLAQSPLKFPEPITASAKPIYDSIIAKAEASGDKEGNAVVSIKFVYHEQKPYWNIETLSSRAKDIKIIGPIAFITQEIIDKANGK